MQSTQIYNMIHMSNSKTFPIIFFSTKILIYMFYSFKHLNLQKSKNV